jgi:hypothetical protein
MRVPFRLATDPTSGFPIDLCRRCNRVIPFEVDFRGLSYDYVSRFGPRMLGPSPLPMGQLQATWSGTPSIPYGLKARRRNINEWEGTSLDPPFCTLSASGPPISTNFDEGSMGVCISDQGSTHD